MPSNENRQSQESAYGSNRALHPQRAYENVYAAEAERVLKTAISDETVIKFDHVTKTYYLYANDRARFLSIFTGKRNRGLVKRVHAVDDLSLTVKKGEAVALIGRNGAGKSTTLKMVTGVTHPTAGTVAVTGYVSALLELMAGFDLNLTGRENIRLRGQIAGLTDEEIKAIEPEIIDFAELDVYIDQPIRTYSSGMRSRLGFAFAVAVEPDILVVDETLSVGDAAFKRKCTKRIREIMANENVTVLFVTHANDVAHEFCSRGVVFDRGRTVFDGPIDEATAYYNEHFA